MCGNGKQIEDELNKSIQRFQVNVILWEGRHLSLKNADSKVVVSIGKAKKIIHSKSNKTDCLYFNDFCIFPLKLSLNVLLDKILRIEVHQKSPKKKLIGSFNVELATVWSQPNHQFYHKWAVLVDPKSPAGGVKGFIKCDIVILSKDMIVKRGAECDGYLEDNLLVPYGGIKNRLRTRVILSVYRADSFSPTLSGKLKLIKPYVRITYGGNVRKTSIARGRDAPVWNEELIFLDMFPPLMQNLFIEICDIKSSEESLGNTTIDIRSLYEDGNNGFLPTFGPNFLYLYEPLGKFQRYKNTSPAENSFTYAARLLLSLRTEVIEKFDKEILPKRNLKIGPEKIPPIIEKMYFEYNNFILFAAIFDALLFDAKPRKIKIQLTMGPKNRVENLKIKGEKKKEKKTPTRVKKKKTRVTPKTKTEAPLGKKKKRLKEKKKEPSKKKKKVPPTKSLETVSETEPEIPLEKEQKELKKRKKVPSKKKKKVPPKKLIDTATETESEPRLEKERKELRKRKKKRPKKLKKVPAKKEIQTTSETESEPPLEKERKELRKRKKKRLKKHKKVPSKKEMQTTSETEPETPLEKEQKEFRKRKKERVKKQKTVPLKKEIQTASETESEPQLEKKQKELKKRRKVPTKKKKKIPSRKSIDTATESESEPQLEKERKEFRKRKKERLKKQKKPTSETESEPQLEKERKDLKKRKKVPTKKKKKVSSRKSIDTASETESEPQLEKEQKKLRKRKKERVKKQKKVPAKKKVQTASETESEPPLEKKQKDLKKKEKEHVKKQKTVPSKKKVQTASETESEPRLEKKQKDLKKRKKEHLKEEEVQPKKLVDTPSETEPRIPLEKDLRKEKGMETTTKTEPQIPSEKDFSKEKGMETTTKTEPQIPLEKDFSKEKGMETTTKTEPQIPLEKDFRKEIGTGTEPDIPIRKEQTYLDEKKKELLEESVSSKKWIDTASGTYPESLYEKELKCLSYKTMEPSEKGMQTNTEIATQTASEKETQAALGPKPLISLGKKQRLKEKIKGPFKIIKNIFSKKGTETAAESEPETSLRKKQKGLKKKNNERLDVMEKNIQTVLETGVQTITEMGTQTASETKPETSLKTNAETPLGAKPETSLGTNNEKSLETKPKSSLKTKTEIPLDAKPDTSLKIETPLDGKPNKSLKIETPLDGKPDTSLKTETPLDAKPDTSLKTNTETPFDAKPETSLETKTETPLDAKPETSLKTKTETPIDAKPETSLETQTETPLDAKPETSLETKSETPLERKESVSKKKRKGASARKRAKESKKPPKKKVVSKKKQQNIPKKKKKSVTTFEKEDDTSLTKKSEECPEKETDLEKEMEPNLTKKCDKTTQVTEPLVEKTSVIFKEKKNVASQTNPKCLEKPPLTTGKQQPLAPEKQETTAPAKQEPIAPEKQETTAPAKQEPIASEKQETTAPAKQEPIAPEKRVASQIKPKCIGKSPVTTGKQQPLAPEKQQTTAPEKQQTTAPEKQQTTAPEKQQTTAPEKSVVSKIIPKCIKKPPVTTGNQQPLAPAEKQLPLASPEKHDVSLQTELECVQKHPAAPKKKQDAGKKMSKTGKNMSKTGKKMSKTGKNMSKTGKNMSKKEIRGPKRRKKKKHKEYPTLSERRRKKEKKEKEAVKKLNVVTNWDTSPMETYPAAKGYSYVQYSGNFPCINVFGEWPNSLKRMYCCNVIKKAIQNWTNEINKIKDDLQSQPCSKSPQKLNATLANLSESCENILLLTRVIKLDETDLCRERRRYYDKEIADIAQKIKKASTEKPLKAEKELNKIATYLAKLTKYAQDPENSFPNTEIWLLSGNRTLAQHRIKTEDVAYSEDFNYRGIMSGKTQTILCRGKKGKIKAKLEILIWFGLAENFEECLKILPNGLNQSNALYSPVSNIKIPYRLIINEKHDFQCKMHIFQGKIFFGLDNSGLSNTFVRVIFRGQNKITKISRKTLNPVWDETLVFYVTLYGPNNYIKENPPCVTVEVFGRRKRNNFELIGRCFIAPLINFNEDKETAPPKLKWVSIMSEVREVGQILMAAELLEISNNFKAPPYSVPVPESIRPHNVKYRLEILFWGVRPLTVVKPIKNKVFVTLECGESLVKSPVLRNIRQTLNFSGPIQETKLNLPEEPVYAPPLNIKLFHIGSVSRRGSYVATCFVPSIRHILYPKAPCPCLEKDEVVGAGAVEGEGDGKEEEEGEEEEAEEEEKKTSVLLKEKKKSWLSKFKDKKIFFLKIYEEEVQKKLFRTFEEKKNWFAETYEKKKNWSKKKVKFPDGGKRKCFELFNFELCECKYVNKFRELNTNAPGISKNDQYSLPNQPNTTDTCIPCEFDPHDPPQNNAWLNPPVGSEMPKPPEKSEMLNPPLPDSEDCGLPDKSEPLNPPVSSEMPRPPEKSEMLNPPLLDSEECDSSYSSEPLNPPVDSDSCDSPNKFDSPYPPVSSEMPKPPDKSEMLNPPLLDSDDCGPPDKSEPLNPPAEPMTSKPPDKSEPLNPPDQPMTSKPPDKSEPLNPPAKPMTSKPPDKSEPLNPPDQPKIFKPFTKFKPLKPHILTQWCDSPCNTKCVIPPAESQSLNPPHEPKTSKPPIKFKPLQPRILTHWCDQACNTKCVIPPVETEPCDPPDESQSLNPADEPEPLNPPVESKPLIQPDELEPCESDTCDPNDDSEPCDPLSNFNVFYNPNIPNMGDKRDKTKKPGVEDEDEWKWWTRYRISEECKKEPLKFSRIKIYKEELEAQPEFNGFQDFLQNYVMVREHKKGIEAVAKVKIALKFQKYTKEPEKEKGFLLTSFSNHTLKFIVRVYVVCGKNLAPRQVYGKSNPYLFLQLGKQIISEKKHYVSQQCNPTFGTCFEFQGIFPQDYLLNIRVFDRKIKSKDELIGETTIDLENRFYSKFHATCGLASTYVRGEWRDIYFPSEILRMLCKQLNFDEPVYEDKEVVIEGHKFKTPVSDDEENKIEAQSLMVLKKWHKMPIYGFHLVPEHVEARSLYHPSLKGMEQGKLVLWVDIFPADLTNMPPVVDIRPQPPVAMELRAIVWNVVDVMLDDKSLQINDRVSDIYVKGWILFLEEDIQKTDIHYRSLNGEGNFNWRFIFHFNYIPIERRMTVKKKLDVCDLRPEERKVQCKLEIQVWDNDAFGDDFLGTLILELCSMPSGAKLPSRCTLKMLAPNGGTINLFKIKKTRGWWPFRRLKVKETLDNEFELSGKIDLELEILTEEEAKKSPAGRGRKTPNPLPPPDRNFTPEISTNKIVTPVKIASSMSLSKAKNYIYAVALLMVIIFFLIALYVSQIS